MPLTTIKPYHTRRFHQGSLHLLRISSLYTAYMSNITYYPQLSLLTNPFRVQVVYLIDCEVARQQIMVSEQLVNLGILLLFRHFVWVGQNLHRLFLKL